MRDHGVLRCYPGKSQAHQPNPEKTPSPAPLPPFRGTAKRSHDFQASVVAGRTSRKFISSPGVASPTRGFYGCCGFRGSPQEALGRRWLSATPPRTWKSPQGTGEQVPWGIERGTCGATPRSPTCPGRTDRWIALGPQFSRLSMCATQSPAMTRRVRSATAGGLLTHLLRRCRLRCAHLPILTCGALGEMSPAFDRHRHEATWMDATDACGASDARALGRQPFPALWQTRASRMPVPTEVATVVRQPCRRWRKRLFKALVGERIKPKSGAQAVITACAPLPEQ
jgi:hypothetical protein